MNLKYIPAHNCLGYLYLTKSVFFKKTKQQDMQKIASC